jgi:hypothetical protein
VAALLSIWGYISPRIGAVVTFLQWLAGDPANWTKFWSMFGAHFAGVRLTSTGQTGQADPFAHIDQLAGQQQGQNQQGQPRQP